MTKKVLVCGAGGFIGGHLVTSLKKQGHYVIGADIKQHEYKKTDADEFYQYDLREQSNVRKLITSDIDTIYQLAADMGGAGYIFTGENDADIMHNSAMINLNIAEEVVAKGVRNVFYSSSACMYPSHNQEDPDNPFVNYQSKSISDRIGFSLPNPEYQFTPRSEMTEEKIIEWVKSELGSEKINELQNQIAEMLNS